MTKKRAVITGGSSGIGQSTVALLLERGYDVWVVDKQGVAKVWQGKVHFSLVDVAAGEQIQQVCQEVVTQWESIDVLINCAGVYPSVRMNEYSVELWQECMAVNASAPFYMVMYLLPLLRKKSRSYVVNVTSGAVFLGSRDPGYSASKAALAGLTKSLAKNLASDGVRVNAVSPGPIDTPMSRAGMRPKDVKVYEQNILLQRFGKPEEVAAMIGFLISGEADYITGTTMHVNGGLYCT